MYADFIVIFIKMKFFNFHFENGHKNFWVGTKISGLVVKPESHIYSFRPEQSDFGLHCLFIGICPLT